MRSFATICALSLAGAVTGRGLQAPTPVITPSPSAESLELAKRQGPDAISFAKVLLTAIPEPLRQIAATNLPAISSILWEEFLDDRRPWWFYGLPEDVQSYLIEQFGPQTLAPNPSEPAWSSAVVTESGGPAETSSAGETSAASSQAESSQPLSSEPTGSATVSTESTRASPSSTTISTIVSKSSHLPASESTVPAAPVADPNESDSGMTKRQKIGVGVGVPFALLGLGALAFGCCFLRRRRRQKSVNGSVPPSSPGFIPRFAFQEKSHEDLDQRHPLNRQSTFSSQDFGHMGWDDDVVEPVESSPPQRGSNYNNYNNGPVMAPALFHTHSSNRARGHRTSQQSYTSLRSVPEVSEPDEIESPVLPRQSPPRESPRRASNGYSPPRALIIPPTAAAPQIKRKPVPSSPNNAHNPSADLASQNLLRQTMPESYTFKPSPFGNSTRITSGPSTQVSPLEESNPKNPFSNNYSYVEDYGPEYNDAYIDIEDGLYGHTSLSRYPDPNKTSKTEWPLRNALGKSHRRNKSPMWDRVYEG